MPVSNCSSGRGFNWQMRGAQKKQEYKALTPGIEASVPAEFQEYGLGFWWGALQGYLARPTLRLATKVAELKQRLGLEAAPVEIGLHIRLGDKQRDKASKQAGVDGGPARYFEQAELAAARLRARGVGCSDAGAGCRPLRVYVASDSGDAIRQVSAGNWNR